MKEIGVRGWRMIFSVSEHLEFSDEEILQILQGGELEVSVTTEASPVVIVQN